MKTHLKELAAVRHQAIVLILSNHSWDAPSIGQCGSGMRCVPSLRKEGWTTTSKNLCISARLAGVQRSLTSRCGGRLQTWHRSTRNSLQADPGLLHHLGIFGELCLQVC